MAINCCGRNIIFDTITGVIPTDTCPSICLTVSDPSELPDPPTGCEFALLTGVTLEVWAKILYQWDGASWVAVARVTGSFAAGVIDTASVVLTGTWTVTINGDSYVNGDYEFDPDLAYADIVFTEGACSYVMERVESPVPLLSLFMNDTTLLPFDPTVAANWNGFAGGTQFTDVIVTGTSQVELFGFVTENTIFQDGLGILQYGTNVLTITDHQGFITEISDQTFIASSILGVSFPALQIVGIQAFNSCPSFSSCGSAVITTIGAQAFTGTQMSEGTHLLCTYVGGQAFSGTACVTLNFPLLEEIEVATFDQMASLTSADFAACLIIGPQGFAQCPLLDTVNFPLAHTMGSDAFSCDLAVQGALLTASFPEILVCGTEAFRNQGLTNISLPKCTTWLPNTGLPSSIFHDCTNLIEVYAPLLTAMGDAGENDCFQNISGNTIDITVSSVLQTIDGGNPDGDLVYLAANNTANIIYV